MAVLATETAVLVAAERGVVGERSVLVDPDDSRFEGVGDAFGLPEPLSLDTRGGSEIGVIRALNEVLLCSEGNSRPSFAVVRKRDFGAGV